MASLEPPTTAKVVLNTTKGPIDIELWAKECPKACRNFIQHCVNGYYDGCTFHRIVKDFVVQSGDPTGTGTGGESIYNGQYFEDEFHSRLKFSRRGLVACANRGSKNTNASQFIITMGATPELNGKNTLFGRVVGETMFNVLKIGQAETLDDGSERPLYPVKITSCEVVVPYFVDLDTPNKTAAEIPNSLDVSLKKSKKRTIVKVSYDDEEEEDEDVKTKLKKKKPTVKKAPKLETRLEPKLESSEANQKGNELPKEKTDHDAGAIGKKGPSGKDLKESSNEGKDAPAEPKELSVQEQIEALKSSLKHKDSSSERKKENISALEKEKANYLKTAKIAPKTKRGKSKANDESRTLELLSKFQSKLSSAHESQSTKPTSTSHKVYHSDTEEEVPSDYSEEDDGGDDLDFLGHKFVESHDNRTDQDLLVTIDPREQKELRQKIYTNLDGSDDTKRRR
uniref:ARAD1C12144p n=1 Tax=Blastobotrys adeninivorans TaxID=409370 RepID=A0A060T5H0_BLAAD